MIGWAHATIDLPASMVEPAGAFWAAVLGWRLGDPWPQHPEFRSIEPPEGDGYVVVQTIAEGRPRVHVDLETDDLDAAAADVLAAGAVERPDAQLQRGWRTFRSPGGLPFCLVPRGREGRLRPPARGTEGRRSRLAQICIDSPPHLHQPEVEFWRQLTGWRLRPSPRPEFTGTLCPPDGYPLQFLLQQLGPDDPGDRTRAHLDLGCDDHHAEAARLTRLGATHRWEGAGWITLGDPAGMPFCATGTPPDEP